MGFQKLDERIKEVFGSRGEFAKVLGMSERTIESRLKNQTEFTFSEIWKAGQLLDLTGREVDQLFFGTR